MRKDTAISLTLLSDAEAGFQEIQKAAAEAIEQSEAGMGRSAEEVFWQFRAKHHMAG